MGLKYNFKVDRDAKQYIGIHLRWDYLRRELRCSMDGYVLQALKEFNHFAPKRHSYAPSHLRPREFGAPVQFVHDDTTAPLPPRRRKIHRAGRRKIPILCTRH